MIWFEGEVEVTSTLRRVLAAVTVVGGLSAGSATRADESGASAATIAAAKQEGRVVVYSQGVPSVHGAVAKLFEQKYGIPVDLTSGRSSEVAERARTEHSLGKAIGDAVIISPLGAQSLHRAGAVQPHGPLPGTNHVVAPFEDDGTVLPIVVSRFGILANTALVSDEDEPKSWRDLADPKWKGKMLSDDPRNSGMGSQTFGMIYKTYGREFVEGLAGQKITFSTQFAVDYRRVAAGEFAMYVAFNLLDINKFAGLPLRGVVPAEGYPYSYLSAVLLADAPHPNAARLYMDFLLGDEAQEYFSKVGYGMVTGRKSVEPSASRELTESSRPWGTVPPDQAAAQIKVFADIFK